MYRANLHLNFLCEYGKRKFNSQFNYPKVAAGSVEVIFLLFNKKTSSWRNLVMSQIIDPLYN